MSQHIEYAHYTFQTKTFLCLLMFHNSINIDIESEMAFIWIEVPGGNFKDFLLFSIR